MLYSLLYGSMFWHIILHYSQKTSEQKTMQNICGKDIISGEISSKDNTEKQMRYAISTRMKPFCIFAKTE